MTKAEYEAAVKKIEAIKDNNMNAFDGDVFDSVDKEGLLSQLKAEYIESLEDRIAELNMIRIENVSLNTIRQVNQGFRTKIASLESENARLEKALDMVGRHIVEHENMCPWNVVDGYVADECSECIANDNAIKSECWKAAFIKEATDDHNK